MFRYKFSARADLSVTVGLAHAYGKDRDEMAETLRLLMRGCAAVARYLRQPMSWVESLELDELNRWSEVTSDLLLSERGAGGDAEGPPKDMLSLMTVASED